MREAILSDSQSIADLEAELFPDNNFNELTIANELDVGSGLVVEREGKVVAYAMLRKESGLVDITRLGVLPEFQRQGLGGLLLSKILLEKKPTMLTVRKDNVEAIKLYVRYGFEIVGHLKDDSWVMRQRPTSVGD